MDNATQNGGRTHVLELTHARLGRVRYWGGRRKPLVRTAEQAERVTESQARYIVRQLCEDGRYTPRLVPVPATALVSAGATA